MRRIIFLSVVIVCEIGLTASQIYTNEKLALSPYGALLHRSYSERCGYHCLSSSPGCPKSIDGNPWVYYGNPKRCFLTGVKYSNFVKGPCPRGQVLYAQRSSCYGTCDFVPRSGNENEITAGAYPVSFEYSHVKGIQRGACGKGEFYSKVLKSCLVRQIFGNDVGR